MRQSTAEAAFLLSVARGNRVGQKRLDSRHGYPMGDKRKNGAGDGTRTRDIQLGKLSPLPTELPPETHYILLHFCAQTTAFCTSLVTRSGESGGLFQKNILQYRSNILLHQALWNKNRW
jgi:hypothetical protein